MLRRSPLLLLSLIAACSSGGATNHPSKAPPAAKAASGVKGEEVQYQAGDTQLTGYVSWDRSKKGKRPGVLVVHEWWGHNDYARRRADMLAEMGYTAFALDMYGTGKQAEHPQDAKKFMMEVMENMEAAVARFEAARKLLEAHETTEPEQTAAIGYCFGGAVVLTMARFGLPLKGVASFHGNLSTPRPADANTLKAAILVAHGAADPFVPADQVEAFKAEMKAANADLTFVAYEGAQHAFTNPGATAKGKKYELPLAYQEKADKASWQELEKFLTRVFSN